MLHGLIHSAQKAATRTAKTAALGAAGGLLLAVGVGFLTLAAWLLLVSVTTALNAALILGSAYVGLGLICLVIMSVRGKPNNRAQDHLAQNPAPKEDILNQIVLTFLAGITAGRKARF